MLIKPTPRSFRWQRPYYSLFARQLDVLLAASQFLFTIGWDRLLANRSASVRRRRARWFVQTLLNLGPTFIKIGQALSTRADLLPLEYVEELAQLQDRVPQFDSAEAIAVVESELGSSIYALYREFEATPLASASLGQVHRARLHTGEEVVVKVQRPGLKALFDIDFRTVHLLLRLCDRFLVWTRQYNLEAIYQEFFALLYQEIDYRQEAKNADRFREHFLGYEHILVPQIYWEYCTPKVLTMEYLPGIKIDDRPALEACDIDPKRINQLGICCYLKQLLVDGFFQADPHPGNMAVTQEGNLIFYDFGMMAEVKALAKDQMVKTFFAVLRKDADEVLGTLIQMGLIEPVGNLTPVRRMIGFLLEKFTEKPIDVRAFSEIKNELYLMFEQQPFRLPAQMTFILKALTTLDGIARVLDPEYNLVAAAQPFVRSITTTRGRGQIVGELARQARDFIRYKLHQPNPTELFIRRLEERIEQGEITIRVRSLESDRALKRVNLALKSTIYCCLTGFSCIAGAILLVGNYPGIAIALFCASGFFFLVLVRLLIELALRERLDRLAEK
ncbi:AarF/ABC1/UbiB kinase family protein [Desertifilum sp. FACHB-1129]|uniref:ABC1 atypical kinase-like domain-containing protein n=1 Tax=Desertifilum tharense IPPAS B-1220 TaxID=1781255 RepID=A0A1E5QN33_9CYAN|nr:MULTISPECIES: AarF/ABC1/UbiB kinase family protein [Desertifilum]MDA0213062.1 AarF/ABC1/UbiB kinase family protein [Cyanobacteria bacterium FC1]MBD2312372.1 AarF/ABC1/UbiB kinase family protein [Desertifilum sp. FACHB-1129]MBD2321155.1 AarF/ABC1/UbiB kinase family protein [Desertifilum sp. FACHB-866]MBD2331538.1 AarF/ABC1/UbiB kinase family protein [Desertifilum sp. FACHB-868]OEJ76050.1 hypothetical protein BH720_05690 [Desertifilum tharense IPPAS B-1220]